MARTTTAAVEALLAGHYKSTISTQQFIDAATLVIDRVVTCATAKGFTHTAAELEMIERYLAAHYYTKSDAYMTSKSTGGASASWSRSPEGDFLTVAKDLDPSNCLAATIARTTAGMAWLGSTQGETLSWDERNA